MMVSCGFENCLTPNTTGICSKCNRVANHLCSNECLHSIGKESGGQFCSIRCAKAWFDEEEMDSLIAGVDLDSINSQSSFLSSGFVSVLTSLPSSNPGASPETNPEDDIVFDVKTTFHSDQEVYQAMESFAIENGFKIHMHQYLDPTVPKEKKG